MFYRKFWSRSCKEMLKGMYRKRFINFVVTTCSQFKWPAPFSAEFTHWNTMNSKGPLTCKWAEAAQDTAAVYCATAVCSGGRGQCGVQSSAVFSFTNFDTLFMSLYSSWVHCCTVACDKMQHDCMLLQITAAPGCI